MDKLIKTMNRMVIFALLTAWILTPMRTEAATQKDEALQAYAQVLAGSTIEWSDGKLSLKGSRFSIVYVNKDNVPELLVDNGANSSHFQGYESLYTYKNGKVVLLGTASGSFSGYYPKKNIIKFEDLHMGVSTEGYSAISSGTLKCLLLSHKELETNNAGQMKNRTTYYKYVSSKKKVIAKTITKNQYKKLLKKK